MSTNSYKVLDHIPGDNGIPFFGHFFPFIRNASKFWTERREKYGDVFKYRTPLGSSVVLCGPAANKMILVEESKFTSNKEAWEISLSDLFPNGLMLMDGDQHQYHRSIMNEAFKKEPMQGYLDSMPQIIARELQKLAGQKKVLFFPFFKELTLQLAAKVFFGLTFKDDLKSINKAISDIVNAASALPIKLPFTAYGKGLAGRKYLVNYFQSIIVKKRSAPEKDLFSRLCQAKSEEGHQFTDSEIIDHLIFVLMAAHDTTAITLSMMSYYMAKDLQWQERLREEAQSFELREDIQVKDLRQLEKIGLFMKETLRKQPPLTTSVRKIEKDMEVDGHHIPKDTVVNVVYELTHHDERNWETNPHDFDPERFSKGRNEQSKCPFAYAPFGAGKHHCIGYAFAEMQIKLVITMLLKDYKLSVPEGYECPIKDVPLKNPTDNLPMFIEAV